MSLDTIPLLASRRNPLSVRQEDHIRRFNELNARVKELENVLEAVQETPVKIKKKK